MEATEPRAHQRDPKPDWWRKNDRLREEMELPAYDPPRFVDGTYKHRVVDRLENEHGCDIRLISDSTGDPGDWVVQLDLTPAFAVRRSRTDNGNTVYTLTASAFEKRVAFALA